MIQPQRTPQRQIDVISLGAGVQSSTMALMAAHGELTPMPVAAIFADTQAEPKTVYNWLDWLEKHLPFPVLRITKGDLQKVCLTIKTKKDGSGQRWAASAVPAYVLNKDGSRGIIQRQCTYDYKVIPLTRAAIKLMKQHRATSVIQWIGISLDESHRAKPSQDKRIENIFPLCEKRYSRAYCLKWMSVNKYPTPPRSACVFCPYHSDAEWRRLKTDEPDEFARAVKFDIDYREIKSKTGNMRGQPFLHSSLKPLSEVDFRSDIDRGQGELFGNECEGMCGV